jgi:hypothetical protein
MARFTIEHSRDEDIVTCSHHCGAAYDMNGCGLHLDTGPHRGPGPDCPGPGEYELVKPEVMAAFRNLVRECWVRCGGPESCSGCDIECNVVPGIVAGLPPEEKK